MTSPQVDAGAGPDEFDFSDVFTEDSTPAPEPTSATGDSSAPPPESSSPGLDDGQSSPESTAPEAPEDDGLGTPDAPPPPASAAGAPAPTDGTPPPTAAPLVAPENAQFAFKADGAEVQLKGAWVTSDGAHIVIPKGVWDREFRPHFIGNRQQWMQKERGYHSQIQQLQAAKSQKETEAEAVVAEVAEMLSKGPDAFAEWADNFAINAPLLLERAKANAYKQQLDSRAQQETAQQEQERVQQLIPQLQDRLATALEQALSRPDFQLLAATQDEKVELLRDLWTQHGQTLFWEQPDDDPARGIPKGYIGFNEDALANLLSQRAQQIKRVLDRQKATTSVAQKNKAALQPTGIQQKPNNGQRPAAPAPSQPQRPENYRDFKDKLSDPKSDSWAGVFDE
jgi:hypothetical protein